MAPSSRPTSPASMLGTQDLVFVHTSASSVRSSKSSSSRSGSHGSRARPGFSSSSSDNNRSFDEWLAAYSANKLGLRPDQVPPPPPAILAILQEEKEKEQETRSSTPAATAEGDDVMYLLGSRSQHSLSSTHEEHSEEPLSALNRFRQLGHLQAPAPAWEEERLKLASKFGLEQPRRRAALDSICKIAKRHFGMKTVVISLTFEDHQVLAGEVGWGGEEPGPDTPPRPLTLGPAMCTHALISAPDPTAEDSTFIVGNANEDWRFSKNPYTTGMGGGLAYYAAANVMMDVDEKDQVEKDLPPSLPVGAICLIDDQPRDPDAFTEEDRSMLREFANMIARELTLGHEQRHRDAEIRQSDFLGSFLNSALVLPDKASCPKTPPSSAPPHLDPRPSTPDNPRFPSVPGANASPATHAIFSPTVSSGISPNTTFALATEQLNALTDAESAAIFDLRSFCAPISQDSPELEAQQQRRRNASFSRDLGGQGKLYLMGSSGNVDWAEIAGKEQLLGVVNDALTEYDASATVIFDSSSRVQPLGAVLPSPVVSTVCLPLFDVDGTPALLLILTSTVKHFTFVESDVRFARNVGAITMGYLLRQRAEQADRAKLAFVSQISHELRTPLHGINSQVELIREFSTPSQLRRLAPLLDTAEVCLESLRDVLDDTLDFAKLTSSSTSEEERRRAHARAVTPTNLEQLLEDVSKATWVRKKRTDLVSADVATPNASGQKPRTPLPQVDLILEVEKRAAGWTGLFDLGATKRVLLNLLGNSLKFTQHGHVKLSLRELPRPKSRSVEADKKTTIRLDIEDTGIGMSEEFLRNKLFTPFVQENSFANGAGLGMSICQTIIRRMGGEISVRSDQGRGTKISITLPVDMLDQVDPQPPTPLNLNFASSSGPSTALPTPTAKNADHPSLLRTRIISQELATLFNPGPAHLVLSSSPKSELEALDFSQAVEAAASSKTLVRMPSSRRPRRGSVLGRCGDQEDLVLEAAKLGYSTALVEEGGSGTKLAKEIAATIPPQEKEARKVRVLVADDNPIARNIFTKLFTVKGIPFEQAENGLEAVNLYKAAHDAGAPIDLFVTDIQMPVMDGLEAAHAVREYETSLSSGQTLSGEVSGARTVPRCRIIALTGLSNEEDMRNGSDDIDFWVVKGGKSMRVVLDEIGRLQQELDLAAP